MTLTRSQLNLRRRKQTPAFQQSFSISIHREAQLPAFQRQRSLSRKLTEAKPVFAFTDSQMCSGAYWLASQCRSIIATPSADIGSIGVYCALVDESRALEMEGIKVNAVSAGGFKLAGAPFKPLTDDERAMFQAGVDKIYSRFTSAVTTKRAVDIQAVQAKVLDGEEAVAAHLADGLVNDLDQFLSLVQAKLTPPQG